MKMPVRLPSSTTLLQRLLAATDAARAEGLDASIDTLWNPWTCPVELLPFLAWAMSVDIWDENWPEDVRRAVVGASPRVHRLKGTKAAVEQSLAALRISTEIVEWWETDPPGRRGTFDVTAFVRGILPGEDAVLNAKIQNQAKAFVKAAKPKSRVFSFKIAAGYDNRLGTANLAHGLAIGRKLIEAGPNTTLRRQTGAANASHGLALARRTVSAGPNTEFRGIARAANASHAMTIHRANFAGAA